jgi:hypothetical protein
MHRPKAVNELSRLETMKRRKLSPPDHFPRELKAAWVIYPDYQTGCMLHPQPHNRERIIKLASGGYFANGDMSLASRRQINEIRQFNEILATIP